MSNPDPAKTRRLRPVRLSSMKVEVSTDLDGSIHIVSREPLQPYPARLTERLEFWAHKAPDRIFLAARSPDGGRWQTLRYTETLDRVRSLGQALLDRGLSAERPLVILSGNDIDHGCLALAAMHVGIPYAPISPAYALVASDFGRLRAIFDLLDPGLVFVSESAAYRAALDAVTNGIETVSRVPDRWETAFEALLDTLPGPDVDAATAQVGPDTIAKFLFTSGSTGRPKAVISTQRMLCSNQQMIRQCFAFMQDEPPVLLDWSPWHHTAGGNHNFGIALYNGGTLYIDDGRPTPDGIERTVRNLREVAPTWYFTVPRGYEALLPFFATDEDLRRNFFSRVKMLYVAGAGLAQHVWDECARYAEEAYGERILFGGGLGATETGPFALVCMWEQEHANNCGLPAPGIEFKLAPTDGKYEGRLRSPSVTPGYWKEADLTAKTFDEAGFYRLGDALRPVDDGDLSKGLLFEGRLAENFKLATGTWVNVGALRARFINHCGPLVQDAAITGLNQDYLGALVFPNLAQCRELASVDYGDRIADLLDDVHVRNRFRELLESFGREATGSSTRIEKIALMDEPPSLMAGEITDKESLNQRAVLEQRHAIVESLYQASKASAIIALKRA